MPRPSLRAIVSIASDFPYTTLFRSHPRTEHEARLDRCGLGQLVASAGEVAQHQRSEEHTSELQSRGHLVCRLLLEQKNEARRTDGRAGVERHVRPGETMGLGGRTRC